MQKLFNVGWVERSDTQHVRYYWVLGIATLHPTYEEQAFATPSGPWERVYGLNKGF